MPWFGGSAGVWAVSLSFFQVALLVGYGYSDWIQKLPTKSQVKIHVTFLILSLLTLPILASEGQKPTGQEDPSIQVLILLAATVGLPYFMLSTTGPLVQAWFARTQPSLEQAQKAYRLFALSNLGSLVGLVSYPFFIEPRLTLPQQAWIWSGGFSLFVAIMLILSFFLVRHFDNHPNKSNQRPSHSHRGDHHLSGTPPSLINILFWFLFSAIASAVLLASSNHISQNIASVPFLWVMPLSLYLFSFVIAFEGRNGKGLYIRETIVLPTMAVTGILAWGLTAQDGILDIEIAIPLYCVGLFAICFFCHGELAQSKPIPQHLTRFYFVIASGGAAGGIFVSLIAPRVFPAYWELPLLLFTIGLLGIWVGFRQSAPVLRSLFIAGAFSSAVAVGHYGVLYWDDYQDRSIYSTRNFYGPLRVQEVDPDGHPPYRRLVHGVILHGLQHLDPQTRYLPTTYYGPNSGVGRALRVLQSDKSGASKSSPDQELSLHVGLVGLGVGTLLSYARPHDIYRIYEINPDIVHVARSHFFYLDKAPDKTTIILGDARLQLDREEPQEFHLLAIDAFSSDAIPIHLLTREAMAIYARHLHDDGILAIHVTNRYLALAPVVKKLADDLGFASVLISHEPSEEEPWSTARSEWVLITRNIQALNHPSIANHRVAIISDPSGPIWTDDFHNLLRVLK